MQRYRECLDVCAAGWQIQVLSASYGLNAPGVGDNGGCRGIMGMYLSRPEAPRYLGFSRRLGDDDNFWRLGDDDCKWLSCVFVLVALQI